MSDVWVLDFGTMQWHSVEVEGQRPCPRKLHSMCEINGSGGRAGCVLLFGGFDGRVALSDVWSLEIERVEGGFRGQWNAANLSGFTPSERYGACISENGGRVYMFGGNELVVSHVEARHVPSVVVATRDVEPYSYCLNDFYRFSLKLRMWVRLQHTGFNIGGRWGHSAVQYQGRLYVFGGRSPQCALNDMHCFTLVSEPEPHVPAAHAHAHTDPVLPSLHSFSLSLVDGMMGGLKRHIDCIDMMDVDSGGYETPHCIRALNTTVLHRELQ